MVLEKDQRLQQKALGSDVNIRHESDGVIRQNDSGELQRHHSFDVDPLKRGNGEEGGRKIFKPSTKKALQLSFENIVIRTVPKVKKFCKGKDYVPPEPKTILNGVSGTILPGQFLSIIGASGKSLSLNKNRD
jgi:ABC-type multidrug transport system fused ATPase/permease subunit